MTSNRYARRRLLAITISRASTILLLSGMSYMFLARAAAQRQPTQAEAGPATGSGIVTVVGPGAGREIAIKIEGRVGKEFRYCFSDSTVVLDPNGTRVDISRIQGLQVSFTAAPTTHRGRFCQSPMEVTKITLLPLEPLAGNSEPEQPSGPNEDAMNSDGQSIMVERIDYGKREIDIEGSDTPFFYDRNLVLTDADGKLVSNMSVVRPRMHVSYEAIWRRRGGRGDWPRECKLTKLVLKDFHAAHATPSPAATTSPPSTPATTKAAAPVASVSSPRTQASSASVRSKLSESEKQRLQRNHYATFFRDTVPAGFELRSDRGLSRYYTGKEQSFEIEIREHEPGARPVPAPTPGKPFEKATYANGNFQGYDFFATWDLNSRLNVFLSVGPQYVVEFKYQEEKLNLSRPDIDAVQKINEFLTLATQVIDLPRLAADAGWKNAPEPTPPPDLVSRLPKSDGSKQTDLDSVLRAVDDQPQQVKDWAGKFYDLAPGYTHATELYDRGKWALRATEERIRDPYIDYNSNIHRMDYRGIEFRPGIERYMYEEAKRFLRDVPENRLEKVAQLAAKLAVDKFVATQNASREQINETGPQNKAVAEARAIAGKLPPPGSESTPTAQTKTPTKRPTPSPSPLAAAYADPDIQVEDLGPMPKDPNDVAVSADGLHVAAVIPSGEGQVVYYDGKPGPEYDKVLHFLYGKSPAVVFSKDGTHAAYLAVRGESQLVWADGKETVLTSKFLNSDRFLSSAYFKFSPGGEHLAYACDLTNSTAGSLLTKTMIVDGVQQPPFYVIEPIIFSEQGGHYAYVAKPEQTEPRSLVVVDGTQGAMYSDVKQESLRLSPDGIHCAYIATKVTNGQSWFVVLDGNEQRSYDDIESLQFSSTGHYAYVGVEQLSDRPPAYRSAVVLDGKEIAEYRVGHTSRHVEQLQFSPDGNRLAYVAKTGDGVVVVVDGKPGRPYDLIQNQSLRFSPDSSSVSYYGKIGDETFVVTDERASIAIHGVKKFTYSEKANTDAFLANKDSGCIAVVDNQPSKSYQNCYDVAVSPDGSRSAYAMSVSIGQPELVVDGQASKLGKFFDSFEETTMGEPNAGPDLKTVFRFSPDSRHLAIALRVPSGGGETIVVDGRPGPAFPSCQRFGFSSDGAHFAYLGRELGPKGTTIKVVLDHKVVQTFGPLETMAVFAASTRMVLEKPPPDSRSFAASAPQANWFAFRGDGKLKFLATKDEKIYRVTITPGVATGGLVIAKTESDAPVQSGKKGTTRPMTGKTKVTSPEKQPAPDSTSPPSSESQPPIESAADQPSVNGNADTINAGAADSASGIADTFVQAISGAEVEAVASLYADTVDYMKSGRIGNAAVQSQVQEYFARWPVRQWVLSAPARVSTLGGSRTQVTFTARYDVSDPQTGRRATGTAKEIIVLAPDASGAMKIVSQQEQTRAADKPDNEGRRGRHDKVYPGKPVDRRQPLIPIPPNIPWPPNLPHP